MTQLTLQSDLGIEHVADLQAALHPHLEADAPLELAGDQVERVHAAGLQLLHAFVRRRRFNDTERFIEHHFQRLPDSRFVVYNQ